MSKSVTAVIGALEKAGGFASAQEVFQLMRKQGKSTGLATVYRALQKQLLIIKLMSFEKRMAKPNIDFAHLAIITI